MTDMISNHFRANSRSQRFASHFIAYTSNKNRLHHKLVSERAPVTVFDGNAVTKKSTVPQPVLFQSKDEETFLDIALFI